MKPRQKDFNINTISMKKLIVLAFVASFGLASCSTLQSILAEPTNLETVTALREVLNSSAFRAISSLKKLNDGNIEGVLPNEIKPVLATLKTLGLSGEVDKITKTIGDVSALVAEESTGLMTDAIKQVDFVDAVSIVVGGEDAATQVLKKAMYGAVKTRYSERLDGELNKTEIPKYWPMAQSAYNMFSKDKIEGNLSDYLAERAVDAMFLTMGKEETKIRQDPAQLGKTVVTKVFDYYTNKNKPKNIR